MRRKRQKASHRGGANGLSGSSHSSDEGRGRYHRGGVRSSTSGSSDFTTSTDASSGSELSCATVMYLGHSDGSGTDGEHPPGIDIYPGIDR